MGLNPLHFCRGRGCPGLDRSPTLRPPSQGTWAVPLCCQNLQKKKKCRTHRTTQSPAGIFIELSMNSPGARVPARKKIPVSGLSGPFGSCTNSCQAPQKKSGGGFLGLHALTPPLPVRIWATPLPRLWLGNLGRHHRTWPTLDWGFALLLSWLCYTPSRGILLLLGRRLTRLMNLVDLGGLRLQDPFANLPYG